MLADAAEEVPWVLASADSGTTTGLFPAEAEAPRQLFRRLLRDSLGTTHRLVGQHGARRAALASSTGLPPPGSDS